MAPIGCRSKHLGRSCRTLYEKRRLSCETPRMLLLELVLTVCHHGHVDMKCEVCTRTYVSRTKGVFVNGNLGK